MRPRTGTCTGCRERMPLRRLWRAGTVRWHDLVDSIGAYRCTGSGEWPWGAS